MKAIDIAVANLLETPELQPESTREIFKMVEKLRAHSVQITNSMKQTESTLNKLADENIKAMGSFEACMELLARMLPEDLVKEQGAKLNEKKPN